MAERIELVEVAARDGLQNEKAAHDLPASVKAEFIRMLAASGLTRIEAGSFVHPKAVPAMANTAEVAELLKPIEKEFSKVIFSYLVPNLKGLERAKAVNAREIAIFLAVSEAFSKANINQTVNEAFASIVPTVKAAIVSGMRVRGYLSNIFGYTDLPFSPELVAKRSKELLAMGCFEVSLGDTTALGTPEMTEQLIAALVKAGIPLEKVAMHFHDTNGRAIENVAVSYDMGIRVFDAATGGIGGCPYANSPKGNLAMESLLDWCAMQGIQTPVANVAELRKAAAFIKQKL